MDSDYRDHYQVEDTAWCVLTLLKPISFRCTQKAFKTLEKSSFLQVYIGEAVRTKGPLHRAGLSASPLGRLEELVVVEDTHRVQLYALPVHVTALTSEQVL